MSETNFRKRKWRSQKEAYLDALRYMRGRQRGEITSLKTPWPKFNDAIADGIEWNSTTVIAARPATGKTLIKDQIVREAFALNPNTNFRVLEFSLEMVGRVTAMRAFSSFIGRAYEYLCSAEGKITEEDFRKCCTYGEQMSTLPIDVIDEPCTVNEFRQHMAEYIDAFSVQKTNEKGEFYREYTKTIVTLDHSLLLKSKAPFEKDKHDTLFALGEALTDLKRKYPIAFIILSQLNRDIDRPERNEDGKVVRVPIPPLTEERRKQMAKKVRAMGEDSKTGIRQVRRETNEAVKALEQDGRISEDDGRRALDECQKLTDQHTAWSTNCVRRRKRS